jgi:arylsulfatase
LAGKMIMSFKKYPPRQKPASFNLDQVMQKLTAGGEGK